jgi:hypothetical protein
LPIAHSGPSRRSALASPGVARRLRASSRAASSAGVPDEARIEAARGEHRQHDHRAEGDGAGAGSQLGEVLDLHQRGEHRDDEDIEHRPAADDLQPAVDLRAQAGQRLSSLCTETSSSDSSSSFATGTRMLAMKTMIGERPTIPRSRGRRCR